MADFSGDQLCPALSSVLTLPVLAHGSFVSTRRLDVTAGSKLWSPQVLSQCPPDKRLKTELAPAVPEESAVTLSAGPAAQPV